MLVGQPTDGASFIDDLGADSLDTVELVMAFEEEFNVEIPDDAAEKILTVQDAISFIESPFNGIISTTMISIRILHLSDWVAYQSFINASDKYYRCGLGSSPSFGSEVFDV